MPKKFLGENSKAAVAKARKNEAKAAEDERRQKEADDAMWADDDKHVQRKQQRKDDKEKRKNEMLEKKAQLKALEEEEMSALKSIAKGAAITAPKQSRAQIEAAQEQQRLKLAQAEKEKSKLSVEESPLVENVNLITVDGIQAHSVDEAIAVLGGLKMAEVDRHPEKRMKAAYLAFEEINLPRLKAENSNMRLSQLKQLLKKEWNKSPDNPLNKV